MANATTDRRVSVEVQKFAKRRFDEVPPRAPGDGRRVSATVLVYPETLTKFTGRGSKARRKAQLTQESRERAAAWQKLTPQQQLERLPQGGANKQRARIQRAIDAAKTYRAEDAVKDNAKRKGK